MNLKFKQIAAYSKPWEVVLTNLPEDAIIFKIGEINERQQNWVIFIPTEKFNWQEYVGNDLKSTCQVYTYQFLEWSSIYLHDITPIGEWVSMDEESKIIKDFLKTCYGHKYTRPTYEACVDENNILSTVKVNEGFRHYASFRIKDFSWDDSFEIIEVNIFDEYRKKPYHSIVESKINFNGCNEEMANEHTYLVFTHDSEPFDSAFAEALKHLKTEDEIKFIINESHAERLREEYIGRAMQGLLSNPQIINEIVDNNKLESKHEIISNLAIAQVDNLLKKL